MSFTNISLKEELVLLALQDKEELTSEDISKLLSVASDGVIGDCAKSLFPLLQLLKIRKLIISSYKKEVSQETENREGIGFWENVYYYKITELGNAVLKEHQALRTNIVKWSLKTY